MLLPSPAHSLWLHLYRRGEVLNRQLQLGAQRPGGASGHQSADVAGGGGQDAVQQRLRFLRLACRGDKETLGVRIGKSGRYLGLG